MKDFFNLVVETQQRIPTFVFIMAIIIWVEAKSQLPKATSLVGTVK
jgi:hypothetical protein